MSRHERRYQKYLARHQARRTTSPGDAGATARTIAMFANAPIRESLVPAKLFELGIGNLVFSRSLPDGRLALAMFLLDVFCLGIKNASLATVARAEYAQHVTDWRVKEQLQPMDPACFRKLVEGGVAYALELGFSPHVDYADARQIFGDVQAAACPTPFEYGHEGKPFYVSGPNETLAQARAIVDQLDRRRGAGNFDYLVLAE